MKGGVRTVDVLSCVCGYACVCVCVVVCVCVFALSFEPSCVEVYSQRVTQNCLCVCVAWILGTSDSAGPEQQWKEGGQGGEGGGEEEGGERNQQDGGKEKTDSMLG